mgnify:CR=1 FL=1
MNKAQVTCFKKKIGEAAWERLPEYDARFSTPPDTPAELQAGAQATVHLNLQNYGRLGWRDDGGVRLGYRNVHVDPLTTEDEGGINLKKIAPKARVY